MSDTLEKPRLRLYLQMGLLQELNYYGLMRVRALALDQGADIEADAKLRPIDMDDRDLKEMHDLPLVMFRVHDTADVDGQIPDSIYVGCSDDEGLAYIGGCENVLTLWNWWRQYGQGRDTDA